MLKREQVEASRVNNLSISASLLIRAAKKLKLECEIFAGQIFKIRKGQKEFFFKSTHVPCNDHPANIIADNKYFVREVFKKNNLPTPASELIVKKSHWNHKRVRALNFPLVVKPINASHGNGATMKITTYTELKKAVYKAFAFMEGAREGDKILVEEYFTGYDLRLLVVGNKVVSVLLRDPAHVIGDGTSTIKELILQFNKTWKPTPNGKYDLPLCPVPFDTELQRCLSTQGIHLNTVPEKNEKLYVRWNGNISTGGIGIDITEKVHKNIKNIAIKATKLLKLQVCGVDMLCKDYISGNTSVKNTILLELNGSPGLDVHQFTLHGKGRDVSTPILKHIFKIK
ncbi:MAG: hypothetical protein A3F54_02235 [Candidatus Kerfeldbacteria bacterium RIFCSPHIGHO2_12_FULL_48_17]|uniref:ATP-grasp domain-containing protein n=1 Tax=Candidatus Kerfeldbacteria bacterium RIFCSPHIGHO2_12_FULL_48_17 TaxID=1798542 RepID=A0A1G2B0T1_9BACT|nr:MAG: hypothetical protein A3F54_02235 [Candidatus Kerfeldbacteria bacterium RIFCSPHIGHO2_12_FULL_48_17]